jgi:hypothetical protein
MSGHPDARVIYDPGRFSLEQAALLGARAEGCTCEPDIRTEGVHAYVAHDDWCALLRRKDTN